MPLRQLQLDNGARLYLDPVPGEETVALAVGFLAGSSMEPSDKRGLAHLTEHMLFRSNERYSGVDIDRLFELNGAEANAYTSRDVIAVVYESIPESFEKLLDVIYWMLHGRRIDPDEFEREKSVVLQEIGEAESNPRERIYDLAFLSLYGRSDLGDPVHGYRETVERLEPRDIIWFKECFFAGRIAYAVLSGAYTERHVEAVKRLLLSLPEHPCSTKTPGRREPRDIVEESGEISQVYLAYAMEVEGSDELLSAARFMLSDGATSLIFEKLRTEKGLIYSYGVVYDATPWTKTLAVILEGVAPERLDEAREALLEVIEGLDSIDPGYAEGRKRYFRLITRPSKVTMFTRALPSLYLAVRGQPMSFDERRDRLLKLDWTRLKPRIGASAWSIIKPRG